MSEPTLRAAAIQKSLELSEQEALKILVFIAGMEAGRALQFEEKTPEKKPRGKASRISPVPAPRPGEADPR